jgi:hypothetical protein
MKNKLLKVSLLILIFVALVEPAGAQKRVPVNRDFTLRAGREVYVSNAGFKIRFKTVVEDSRCPKGVDCVWAGNAKVILAVKKGTRKTVEIELNTNSEPQSATYLGYEIKLERLNPYPQKDVEIKKGDYVAVLKVRKK